MSSRDQSLFLRLFLFFSLSSVFLVASPQLSRIVAIAGLVIALLRASMRPPRKSKVARRILMLNQLQSMVRLNLAQYENKQNQHYTPQEYRLILQAFDRLKSKLAGRLPKRYRLRYLVDRIELLLQNWKRLRSDRKWKARVRKTLKGRRESKTRTKDRPSPPTEKPTWPFPKPTPAPQQEKKSRLFNPYRDSLKKRRQERAKRSFDFVDIEAFVADNKAFAERLPVYEARLAVEAVWKELPFQELGIEFNAADEKLIQLPKNSKRFIETGSRLRVLLASTGIVLPSITFNGSSERLTQDSGLCLREVERACFQLNEGTLCPIPSWISTKRNREVMGTRCIKADEDTEFPLPQLDHIGWTLLNLLRFINRHLPELVSRESLLAGVGEPGYPSARFLSLAREHLRRRGTVPTGEFLELALGFSEGAQLQPSENDVPAVIAAAKSQILSKVEICYVVMTILGNEHSIRRREVYALLPTELQNQLKAVESALPEQSRDFHEYLEFLASSAEWKERFGPPRFSSTVGLVLVERLLQSSSLPESNPFSADLCAQIIRRDPSWCALTLALSHVSERSTTRKVRLLAKQSPRRLARIITAFHSEPLEPYLFPLERLSVLCHSLGDAGDLLQTALKDYFPKLPKSAYTPEIANASQQEMLARTRYWAVRGLVPQSAN